MKQTKYMDRRLRAYNQNWDDLCMITHATDMVAADGKARLTWPNVSRGGVMKYSEAVNETVL